MLPHRSQRSAGHVCQCNAAPLTAYRSFPSWGKRACRLPVSHTYVPLLLHLLQNGHTLLWKEVFKGVRAILHERFHPARDASSFPEVGTERLVDDRQKMVANGLAGQGEEWPVTLIVKFRVAGGVPVTEGV